jgi:hypothetical protein
VETVLKKLDRVLRQHFSGSKTFLEPFEPEPFVGGILVWDGFLGIDPRQRVKRVWDILKRGLGARDLKRVGMIMPLTIDEMNIHREQVIQDDELTRIQKGSKSS